MGEPLTSIAENPIPEADIRPGTLIYAGPDAHIYRYLVRDEHMDDAQDVIGCVVGRLIDGHVFSDRPFRSGLTMVEVVSPVVTGRYFDTVASFFGLNGYEIRGRCTHEGDDVLAFAQAFAPGSRCLTDEDLARVQEDCLELLAMLKRG